MDLSSRAIGEVIHPTAAFTRRSPLSRLPGDTANAQLNVDDWEGSLLNPKNRIDSLDIPSDPLWRIDGCGGLGTQYFVLPLFIPKIPPIRMDVFVEDTQPPFLNRQLELATSFHTKDADRLSKLAITRHIIRTLNLWTKVNFPDLESFGEFYKSVPFGSRLVFENLSLDIRKLQVKMGLNHDLERKLMSLSALKRLWGADFTFPEVVDLLDVEVEKILYESVCLVRIRGQLFVFKALTSGVKYLYHELKMLCTLEPHPHVIARPIHIISKLCQFGAKRAVVGFTTFYHSRGSLRDILPQLRIHGRLRLSDQMKWSVQLATALEHLRSSSKTYYPDLRLDNVVLSDKSDIVMVDFEQRGVWCEFAAPEVNAIEYIRLIATDENVPYDVREKYSARLRKLVPNCDALDQDSYINPEQGYCIPWIALSAGEQEAAEVYMLGRLLWCIFEGVSGPQKAAVWQSYRWESHLEFPEYERTPPTMRALIDRCTRGRRDTLDSKVKRERSKLILCDSEFREQNEETIKEAARQFWLAEMEVSEKFLDLRDAQRRKGEWNENYFDRPNLQEVLAALRAYQTEHA
ncbi:hypothetical protein DL766_002818 [Monosporascus sp. MC13-8B]|nr:hypothetical protein DL763_006088 [Monosporascus cannonballus]RYP34828.1 hypothetical protein DL766_002818 [Monosporascus sp. MC13-8B]